MTELVTFPDTVTTLRALLDPHLTEPIVQQVPKTRPAAFVQIYRTGGVSRDVVIDGAFVTVDSWAATDPAAMLLAQTVRAWIHGLERTTVTLPDDSVVTVYLAVELAGPASVPDPESGSPRVRQSFQIGLRGHVTTQ